MLDLRQYPDIRPHDSARWDIWSARGLTDAEKKWLRFSEMMNEELCPTDWREDSGFIWIYHPMGDRHWHRLTVFETLGYLASTDEFRDEFIRNH